MVATETHLSSDVHGRDCRALRRLQTLALLQGVGEPEEDGLVLYPRLHRARRFASLCPSRLRGDASSRVALALTRLVRARRCVVLVRRSRSRSHAPRALPLSLSALSLSLARSVARAEEVEFLSLSLFLAFKAKVLFRPLPTVIEKLAGPFKFCRVRLQQQTNENPFPLLYHL